MKIFIAKLNFSTESEDLRKVFEMYGTVTSSNVVMDKYTGRSRGFAFVEMENQDEAFDAIKNLNNTELHSRTIVVKKAEAREEGHRPKPRW